ncbi:MAG TPA: ABC transporter substrate-binding protein [Streptosporangiaceae bacterium]|nr:ABC transporter substrate-binding protein [Streptosporangiaceae bacterium]
MNVDHGRLDHLRAGHGAVENHVIDEFVAGRLTRRDFLRRGAVVGISFPVLGAILSACGSSGSPTTTSSSPGAAGKAGATIKVGIIVPAAAINPLTIADQGGIDMLGQAGEYLIFSNEQLLLQPQLAESWTSNPAADVWTYKIRQGVKFHDGSPLTADDVVYTYKLQTNPKSSSNALSAFGGVLAPAGVRKVDNFTVAFHLEAPNGNFPYLTSSDNYNMIILPKNYDPAKWESSFIGTGPFVMKSYTPKVGASFTRNEQYWGTKALPAATEFTFYDSQTPQVLALTGGTLDVVGQFSVSGGEQLLAPGAPYNIVKLKSSAHRELSMRTDKAPFTDPRVRQAIALTIDRPAIVTALFKGQADLGNDSPLAPVMRSTNPSIPQRAKDIAKAKALLSAAGHSSGFSTQLIGNNTLEIPQYGQIVAQAAKSIGVTIHTKFEDSGTYYGKATFGNSDWLDATMSLVDYGHRSVPNVFLTAPLETINAKAGTGSWNAAHFNNKQYDNLVKQYVAAVDLNTQRRIAGQIETLLLSETPIIYAYFYDYLAASAKNVHGIYPTAIGHIFVNNVTKS